MEVSLQIGLNPALEESGCAPLLFPKRAKLTAWLRERPFFLREKIERSQEPKGAEKDPREPKSCHAPRKVRRHPLKNIKRDASMLNLLGGMPFQQITNDRVRGIQCTG